MIKRIVLRNLFFYWKKNTLITILITFLFFLAFTSFLFINKIKKFADAPLNSLKTEIILQWDKNNKNANQIKTTGVIEPFSLESLYKDDVLKRLSNIKGIKETSSSLVLWQFDIKNNRTIIGLNVNDPLIGLRKIEHWLMPKSNFFSNDNALEVILERHFSRLFGYKLNTSYKINNQDYKIVGIVDFKEESNLSNAQIFMPYKTALSLLNQKKTIINQIYISLSNASLLSKVQKEIRNIFSNISIITKDRLLKNLSSFNRLIYKFGDYFSFGISFLALILIFWILKMNQIDLGKQTRILQTIGWPKQKTRQWMFFESSLIIVFSLFTSLIFLLIFYFSVLPYIGIEALLNQNFRL